MPTAIGAVFRYHRTNDKGLEVLDDPCAEQAESTVEGILGARWPSLSAGEHDMIDQSAGDAPEEPEGSPRFDPYTGERLDDHRPPSATSARAPLKGRPKKLTVLVAVAIVAMIGGSAWYVTGPMADAKARDEAKTSAAAAAKTEEVRVETCQDMLTGSYKSLASIDSRLDVGMIEADYTASVGQAKASFDGIDAQDAEESDCSAYADLEVAINKYSAASTYWNDCIVETYCTVEEAKLSVWWSAAGDRMAAIKAAGVGNAGTNSGT